MQLEVASPSTHMRIVCPSCEVAYEVEDRLLRPGRATKFARCEHRWVPLAEVAPVEPLPLPAPPPPEPPQVLAVPTAMDRLSAASAPPPPKLALRLAWAGSAIILLLFCTGLYIERQPVMGAWPPSIRLYALLGLAPAAESPHRVSETKHEGAEHGTETGQHPADRGH